MRYLVLMYGDEKVWPQLSAAEQQEYLTAHVAFAQAVRATATMIAGEALADTDAATTLRHEPATGAARVDGDRPVLTDGPFAETTEQLGGFYLVDADNLDLMTELCRELPHSYTVEIRPVIDLGDELGQPDR